MAEQHQTDDGRRFGAEGAKRAKSPAVTISPTTVRFGRSRVVHALTPDAPYATRLTWCFRFPGAARDVTYADAGAEAVTCRRCLARGERASDANRSD